MQNPKYSDSVNAANGCLIGCLDIFGDVCLLLLVFLVGPYIGLLLLCWWVVAWILGLIFHGKGHRKRCFLICRHYSSKYRNQLDHRTVRRPEITNI